MSNTQIYWSSTSLLALVLVASAASYVFSEATIVGLRDLGFPDAFRYQLAVLKPFAAAVLMLPAASPVLKEWAYAGTALFFLTAIVAHLAHRDAPTLFVLLALFSALLVVSRVSYGRLHG